jgi:hypothetical protein
MIDLPSSEALAASKWEVRILEKVGRRYVCRTVEKFPTMFHASAWARKHYPGGNWMIVNPLQDGFYTP